MRNELKKNLTYNKAMLILSLLCVASGLCAFVFSELVIPVASALLAAIIIFEDNRRRIYSYISALSLILINGIMLFFAGISFWSVITIVLAVILAFAFARMARKYQVCFLLTVIVAILLIAPLLLSAMIESGEFTFSAAISFYDGIFSQMRENFMLQIDEMIEELASTTGLSTVDSKYFIDLYDYQVRMLISYIIIAAFILVGFSFKCFSAIVKRCSEDASRITEWRFWTDNIFAYFYFILTVASLFITTPDSVFAVTVLNLYNVFMFVYFYIGFMVAREFFYRGKRPLLSTVLLVLAIVMFSAYAIELLAVNGAFYTIRVNNEKMIPED